MAACNPFSTLTPLSAAAVLEDPVDAVARDQSADIARALGDAIADIAQAVLESSSPSALTSKTIAFEPPAEVAALSAPFANHIASLASNSFNPEQPRDANGRFSTTNSPNMPRRITHEKAVATLKQGRKTQDTSGRQITFGTRLLGYVASKPDGAARLSYLNAAIRAVARDKNPEVESDRIRYRSLFRDRKNNTKGIRVLADKATGEVFNLFPDRNQNRKKGAPSGR